MFQQPIVIDTTVRSSQIDVADLKLDDGGNPARGMLVGLALSVPFWAIVALIIAI